MMLSFATTMMEANLTENTPSRYNEGTQMLY